MPFIFAFCKMHFATGFILLLIMLTMLSGCQSTEQPSYPGDLQLIIAQNQSTTMLTNGDRSLGSSISVAQLLADVRRQGDEQPPANDPNADLNLIGQPTLNDIISTSTNNASNSNTNNTNSGNPETSDTNIKTMTLKYQPGADLPFPGQTALAQRIVERPDMQLMKMAFGGVKADTGFAGVVAIQQRAKKLLALFAQASPSPNASPASVEFQPHLGDDLVIITLRRSVR